MDNNAINPSVIETTCCIVGGGPAGIVLGLLLARKGVKVTLLEAHKDFDREFRGDTIHPSTMEVLDQLGLADRLMTIPHGKLSALKITTAGATYTIADFSGLNTKFPYVTVMPQARFLDFLATEAKRFESFRLITLANVSELIEEAGVVKGVRYRGPDGVHEIRAALVVGCDGRFSTVRKLAGLELKKNAPPMDILWFRLPREPDDPEELSFRIGGGHMLAILGREDHWQLGYIVAKGSYRQVKEDGIETLRNAVSELAPEFAQRMTQLADFSKIMPLSVESGRLSKWSKPGLLCIGDAAHVMTPAGGVGINYAVQDAIEAANLLTAPLLAGSVTPRQLEAVEQRRLFPTKLIQRMQVVMQERVLKPALANKPFLPPWPLRTPVIGPMLHRLLARLILFGIRRVRLVD